MTTVSRAALCPRNRVAALSAAATNSSAASGLNENINETLLRSESCSSVVHGVRTDVNVKHDPSRYINLALHSLSVPYVPQLGRSQDERKYSQPATPRPPFARCSEYLSSRITVRHSSGLTPGLLRLIQEHSRRRMPLGLQTVVLSSRPVVVIRCFRVSGDHLIALPRISHKLPGRKRPVVTRSEKTTSL